MPPTAPPAAPPVAPARPQPGPTVIDENIRRTRRGLWLMDLGAGVVTLLIGVLLYLLAAALLDHWIVPGGLSGWGRLGLFVILIVGIVWFAYRAFVPLMQPINPVYAAHAIESSSPRLKNSLLNLLLFRTRRGTMSKRVYQAIEQQAAERLAETPLEGIIDRTALLRLGYLLAAVIAVCAAYQIFSPKDPAVSAQRVLAPWSDVPAPSRVQIVDIAPGEASVARGERLEVSAEVLGVDDDESVRLYYSTVDRQLVDQSIEMHRAEGTMRYRAVLPAEGPRRAETPGIQQDLDYWIEAGDARSSDYRVAVYARPTLVVTAVHYEYPAYTGYRSETIRDTGDIRGIEATRVRIEAVANQPIETAAVDFDADGRVDLAMQVDGDRASATFQLALRDDRRTPEHGSYVLRLKTTAGRENRDPPVYQINVTPDYPPELRQVAPEESPLDLRVDESVRIAVEARDPDFALGGVSLHGRVGQRSLELGQLLGEERAGNFAGGLELTPEAIDLQPGEVLEYWARATDNRQPTPNWVETARRQLRIVAPGNRELPPNQQQQQQDQQQQQPQEGEAGESGGQGGQGQEGGAGAPQQGEPGEENGEGADGQGGQAGPEGANDAGGQNAPANGGQGAENQSAADSPNGDNAQPDQAQPEQGQQDPSQQDPSQQDPGQQDSGQQDPGQNGEPSQPGQANQGDGAQPDPVSSEGDQDGQAFERMAEHFDPASDPAEQGDNRDQGAQPDAQQPDNQQQPNNQQQPDGQQPPGEQQPQPGEQPQPSADAQPGRRDGQPQPPQAGADDQPAGDPASQEQSKPQGQTDRQGDDASRGAAGQPNDDAAPGQQQQQPSGDGASEGQPQAEQRPDGERGQPGDQPSPSEPDESARPNGGQPGEQPSSETPDNPNAQSDGTPEPSSDDPAQQPGMPNRNQGEPGDGAEPGEQQGAPDSAPKKPADKTDSPTESQSPDDAGAPADAEGQEESDTQGEQSGDRSGEGQEGAGQQADAPGQGGAGENQPSDQGAGASDQQGPGETGQASGETPSEAADAPSDNTAAAEPGEGRTAEAAGQSDDESPADRQSPDRPPTDAAGSSNSDAPEAGGQPGGQPGDGEAPAGDPLRGDDPNLEYARQQTDLVLNRLEDQLAQQQVDESLLDKLGWSEEDLKRFVNRWKGLKQRAAGGNADDQQQLADALRKLGLRRDRVQRFRAGATADSLRDLNETYRSRVPQKYRDQARAYVEGVSSGADQP